MRKKGKYLIGIRSKEKISVALFHLVDRKVREK